MRAVAEPSKGCTSSRQPTLLQRSSSRSSSRVLRLSRHLHNITAAVAAANSSRGGYTSNSDGNGRRSSANNDSNNSRRVRERHYYDSTPRHKSKKSTGGDDSLITDAVAQAFAETLPRPSSKSGNSFRSTSNRTSKRSSSADVDSEDDDGDDEDVRGWWEVPREQQWGAGPQGQVPTRTSPMDLQLEPWQEQQLLLAAASSKKKMQVQTVAANVGLDRTEVLAWVAAFRAKPKAEQTKLLAPLKDKIQEMRQQQQQQAAATVAAAEPKSAPQTQTKQQQVFQHLDPPSAQQQQQGTAGLPFSAKNPDTGFLPFSSRRAQGGLSGPARVKRLSGEVLRTLEGVYGRSPWPNKEVVQGLFNLHKIPRDTVLEWFAARREMDGLPDNPRAAKQLAAAAQRALSTPLLEQQQQQVAAPGAPGAANQQHHQQQQRVQSMTAREMAALRSALPSPRKQKGQKLQAELGIKSGPDASKQMEISGVTFVAKDGRAGWRKIWRGKRSVSGLPTQQLDFHVWMMRKSQQQQQQQRQQEEQKV